MTRDGFPRYTGRIYVPPYVGGQIEELVLGQVERVFREVTKNNLPILLAFWPVFFVAAIGEYSNMHRLPRLEYEPKFGAIMGRLFFVTSLMKRKEAFGFSVGLIGSIKGKTLGVFHLG